MNSFYKVLFNFPSQYLFTIGFSSIFSHSLNIQTTFILHSQVIWLFKSNQQLKKNIPINQTGVSPSLLKNSIKIKSIKTFHCQSHFFKNITFLKKGLFSWAQIPFHSPLLWKSSSFSFPLFIKMLQFNRLFLFISILSKNEKQFHFQNVDLN